MESHELLSPDAEEQQSSTDMDGNADRPHTTIRPVGKSVDWSVSVDDQQSDEDIMQISGAGHWFLEGWIGDHAVDFLVDSGSAVTAVSRSVYDTLCEAGAPVGDLRPTVRRLELLRSQELLRTLEASFLLSECVTLIDVLCTTQIGFLLLKLA